MEWLLGDEDVWSPVLEYRLNRAITLIWPLDRAQKFQEAAFSSGSYGWLLDDEDVWSVKLEYRLKRAITFDPTVV
jgi:hypothetical protein